MGLPVAGAGLTAAAFGMHPLAHQSVAAASWSNSAAYAFVLWSWYFLASSWRSNKPLGRILAGVLLLFLAVFAYEATIVVLGPLTLDLFWRRFRKESPAAGWPKFLLPWILGVGFVVILLAIARMAFAVGKMPLTPPVMIVKNFILYFGALVLPVDMLMLNSVAGFPLPSQFVQDSSALLKLGLIAGIPVLLLLVLLYRYRRSIPLPLDSWAWMWLLAIPMALSPFLLNTSHASETYNYLPVALWCLWVAGRLSAWVQPKVAASAAAVILLLLAGETLLRSNRVRACAATAQTIITTSPLSQWHTGQPRIFYRQRDIPADAPKYGIYAWQGLATVDAQTDMIRALEAALQVASNNPQLTAEAVDDKAFQQACKDTASQCFAVTLDGHVVPSRPPQ
jgi:hypothetical protein